MDRLYSTLNSPCIAAENRRAALLIEDHSLDLPDADLHQTQLQIIRTLVLAIVEPTTSANNRWGNQNHNH